MTRICKDLEEKFFEEDHEIETLKKQLFHVFEL